MDKIVKVDIDGVLRNFSQATWDVLQLEYPEKLVGEKPMNTSWGLMDVYPMFEKKELFRLIFGSHLSEEIFYHYAQPYPGAKEFTRKLQKHGYTIILNTHQSKHVQVPTLQWLHRERIKYHGIFMSDHLDKSTIPDGVLIDDKPDNLVEGDIWVRRPYFKHFQWKDEDSVGDITNEETTDFEAIIRILERKYA